MDKLKTIIDKFNLKYCIVSKEDISYIILAYSYAPYSISVSGESHIDAFYPASNRLYHIGKALERELNTAGYRTIAEHINLKEMAVLGGLGARLNNQLVANIEYGSRMALAGIAISGSYSYIISEQPVKTCDSCNRCDLACPCGALCSGQFSRELCIRQWQSAPAEYGKRSDGKILGCDICQRVCPHNNAIKVQDSKGLVLGKYTLQEFIGLASGSAQDIEIIASDIGRNYARRNYLAHLISTSKMQ